MQNLLSMQQATVAAIQRHCRPHKDNATAMHISRIKFRPPLSSDALSIQLSCIALSSSFLTDSPSECRPIGWSGMLIGLLDRSRSRGCSSGGENDQTWKTMSIGTLSEQQLTYLHHRSVCSTRHNHALLFLERHTPHRFSWLTELSNQ